MRALTMAVSTRPCFSPRNFNKTGPGDEANHECIYTIAIAVLTSLTITVNVHGAAQCHLRALTMHAYRDFSKRDICTESYLQTYTWWSEYIACMVCTALICTVCLSSLCSVFEVCRIKLIIASNFFFRSYTV